MPKQAFYLQFIYEDAKMKRNGVTCLSSYISKGQTEQGFATEQIKVLSLIFWSSPSNLNEVFEEAM